MRSIGNETGTARGLKDPALAGTILVLWVLLGLFILFPLGTLLVGVFYEEGTVSAASLIDVVTDVNQFVAFKNSLWLAFLVGVLGTLLGFLFAFTATRTKLPPRLAAVMDGIVLLPLVSPPFTTAIGMIYSFGARGLVTYQLLGWKGTTVYGLWSTLFSEVLTFFPIAYLALKPMLAAIDSNMERMALSLGAGRIRVFRTVTIPLCIPGLANSFLLLFAASLADFATPLILAGNAFPVLPTQAFLQITGMFDLKGGAVLSFILLVPSMLVFFLQRYWVSRRFYVTVTGKGAGQTPFDSVSPAVAGMLAGLCLAVTLIIFYLYALLLFGSIVNALGANHEFTLNHYRIIFTEGSKAIKDTLIIAAFCMPLGGLYGVIVGYLTARKRFAGRLSMEVVSMLNYALPGTIVGIAYLMAFNAPPIELAGTAIIIIALYVFRYGATGIRTTIAMLSQIDKSIEEASESLGASSGTTFRRITLPLIAPAFFSGLGVVFIRSMTAISATIFLVSINWTLVTVRILENITELSLGPAAAFSVFIVVVVFIVINAINSLMRRFRTAGSAQVTNVLGG